jgi:uncharacterized protein YjbJ (UPF0337 family)
MNQDTATGTANDVAGRVKETAGAATGDRSLQADGIVDQVKGAIQKTIGGEGGVGASTNATVDKAKAFAKARPWATSALVGVLGLAVLGSLRGKGRG